MSHMSADQLYSKRILWFAQKPGECAGYDIKLHLMVWL